MKQISRTVEQLSTASVRLAYYQVRLLLGEPHAQHVAELQGREVAVMYWSCGCAAVEVAPQKYSVHACPEDEQGLSVVREDDELGHFAGLLKGEPVTRYPWR